jgi:hypothetical protein
VISAGFGWLAVALPLAGFASYFRDTLRGRVQPNRVSWALWTASPAIAFAAELMQHTSLRVALATLALGAGPAAVLAASLACPGAYWRTRPLDWVCAGLGAAALGALTTATIPGHAGTAAAAIALSIAADVCAALPTVAKSWTDPQSETAGTYAASGTGSVIVLLTLRPWTFAAGGFPLYVAGVCTVIISLLMCRSAAAWASAILPRSQGRHRLAPATQGRAWHRGVSVRTWRSPVPSWETDVASGRRRP